MVAEHMYHVVSACNHQQHIFSSLLALEVHFSHHLEHVTHSEFDHHVYFFFIIFIDSSLL